MLYRRGIHITTLRHPHSFDWLMFNELEQKPSCLERRVRFGVPPYGNGWSGIKVCKLTVMVRNCHLIDL